MPALYPPSSASPTYPQIPLIQNGDAVGGELGGASNKSAIALTERTENLRMMGIYGHDAAFNYPIGAHVQVGGTVYRSKTSNSNKPPAANSSEWDLCAMTLSELRTMLGLAGDMPVGYGVQSPTEAQRTQALSNLGLLDLVRGSDYKNSVRVVATFNVTPAGLQTIEGVLLVAGNRVLLAGQTDAKQNGIYIVAAGAWARSTDADEPIEVTSGMEVTVEQGTLYKDSKWTLTTDEPIAVGATPLVFVPKELHLINIQFGTTDPTAPPTASQSDKYRNTTTGEIWQWFQSVGWRVVANRQGAMASGNIAIGAVSTIYTGVPWVAPRAGTLCVTAKVGNYNQVNTDYFYININKNGTALAGAESLFTTTTSAAAYRGCTRTIPRITVVAGDVINVGISSGFIHTAQAILEIQYVD